MQLERLVLVGFAYAGPGATMPFLWPSGLLQQTRAGLNLTDVRLVTSDQDVFNLWLQQLAYGGRAMYWTVSEDSRALQVVVWGVSQVTAAWHLQSNTAA